MIQTIIEYVLCYSTAFGLGLACGLFIAYKTSKA